MQKIITSNKINILGDKLISQIKSFKDFFNTPFCVFNNQNMEKWFKTYWLKNENDVLMNIKFLNLSSLLDEFKDKYILARNEDIVFALMKLALSGDIKYDYLIDNGNISSPKLRDFCMEVARYITKVEENNLTVETNLKDIYDVLKKELEKDNKLLLRDYIKNLNINNKNVPIYIFSLSDIEEGYKEFLDKISISNDVYLFLNKTPEFIDVSANVEVKEAPSKIREVEALHSTICDLLKNKDVQTSDIVVYAPNVGDYTSTIERVFRQDGFEYVNIPYVVKTKAQKETNITKALKVMIDIIHKGYYTRYDFYKLATNGLVRYIRDITNDDMNVMIDAITRMNIYRSAKGDFNRGKKRILLQKLVSDVVEYDNLVKMDDGDYLPFGSIDLNDEIIIKYNNLVDDLNDILSLNNDNFMEKIESIFDKWFSLKDYNGFETNNMYLKVLRIINKFKNINNINIDLVFNYLINNTTISNGTKGEILTDGITFLDLNPNTLIPAKYIFMIGMDSSAFPFGEEVNEFYSLKELPSKESISKSIFFDLINNGENKVYISYCSSDLKTDEKFYPTLFIDEMKKYKQINVGKKINKKNKEVIDIKKIDIDETRSYSELYTKREFKNKEYYLNLFKNEEVNEEEVITINEEYNYKNVDKISISNLSNFIMEPLINKVDRLMAKYVDNYSAIKEEYEPLKIDNYNQAIIESNIIIEMLEDLKDSEDEDYDEYLNKPTEEIRKKLVLDGFIPDDKYGEVVYKAVAKDTKNVVKGLLENVSTDYVLVEIPFIDIDNNGETWKLTSNKKYYLHVNGNERYYAKSKALFGKLGKKIKEFIEIYLFALMDIINIDDLDLNKKYDVYLFGYKAKNRYERKFTTTKKDAINNLNNFYKQYNNYLVNKCVPLDALRDDKIETLYDLFGKVMKGEWSFSDNRSLFNMEKDLGYDDESFSSELMESKNEVMDLFSQLLTEDATDED